MEDPVAEIPHIIHLLTESIPSVQQQTVEKFFTSSASLTHPFCRTGSFEGSRWLILCIYRFYKIMSPRIDLEVQSVAFDSHTLTLYVSLSQTFYIFIIPFYKAPVRLTTILSLTTTPPSSSSSSSSQRKPLYYIAAQNDLYQTSEFIKFVAPFGIGVTAVAIWQFFATVFCVLGSWVLCGVTWAEEKGWLPLSGEVIRHGMRMGVNDRGRGKGKEE
ncbi:hypothetical protein AJ80_02359 [Polytolypa hystricis UAMH7299]|uniref:SigF-like NTF2-like domain-containing protein n=1 Tax=Polytolypa hystricis (strain UAMH7299) TaxID=1447883 RepID=A0A2B7YRB2_POLH7|nr:hypothetical protein AJ80_02359 [Polytolypa hystricis UAMH7299]